MRTWPWLTLAALCATSTPALASFINYSSREINVKIVYFGSETAGLSENLQYVYGKTSPEAKGKLISLATETDRVLFFDFLPPALGEIRGFKTRFHLYTVPGKVQNDASRRLILKGVDGIVFVADASPEAAAATLEAWEGLKRHLAEQGYDWRTVPIVYQLDGHRTKRPTSAQELIAQLHLPADAAVFHADPVGGAGVFDSLKAIAKKVLLQLKKGADAQPAAGATKASPDRTAPERR